MCNLSACLLVYLSVYLFCLLACIFVDYLFACINLYGFFITAVNCTALTSTSSQVTIIPGICSSNPPYQVTCQYLCPAGYRLNGLSIKTCLGNGLWNHNGNVSCQGMNYLAYNLHLTIICQRRSENKRITPEKERVLKLIMNVDVFRYRKTHVYYSMPLQH